jgi:hypothetical protein
MSYTYRKGKLQTKGIQLTLKNLIFFRSALSQKVLMQPTINLAGAVDCESKPQPQTYPLLSEGTAAVSHKNHEVEAMLRLNVVLHEKLNEQEQRMYAQDDAIAQLQQNMLASAPSPQRYEAWV